MTASPQPLTAALLDRFAQVSARAGGPLLDVLEPGLTDNEIRNVLAPLDMQAPPELSVLWRWGVVPERPASGWVWDVHYQFALLPPGRAVREMLERQKAGLEPHVPSWIAFAVEDDPRYLVVDGDSSSTVNPVIRTTRDSYVGAASMGDLFAYWTRQIENGECYFENGLWLEADDAGLPLPLR